MNERIQEYDRQLRMNRDQAIERLFIEDVLRGAVDIIAEQRTSPHGPPASSEDGKVAGDACITLCAGDRDKARTLWKLIAGDLGYMPHSVCVALVRAANTVNLVPDIEAPTPL